MIHDIGNWRVVVCDKKKKKRTAAIYLCVWCVCMNIYLSMSNLFHKKKKKSFVFFFFFLWWGV